MIPRAPRFTKLTVCLALAQVSLIAWLPVMPGHDLPQHLTYARILASASDPFVAGRYDIDTTDPYCTIHRLLAVASRFVTLDHACRALLAVYALVLVGAFAWLGRTLHGRRGTHVGLLGVALVWNPITCMGFLPFAVTLPLFVLGVVLALRFVERRSVARGLWVVAATVAVGKLHIVGLGFFVLFVVLLALASFRRGWVLPLVVGAGALVVVGTSHSSSLQVTHIQGVVWSYWNEKANMILATFFGPFPRGMRLAVELGALALAAVVALSARPEPRGAASRAFLFTALAYGLVALEIPSAVREPDDLSYIDFRFFVFAAAMLLAATPPGWFASRAGSTALRVAMVGFVGCWARQLVGAAHEAGDVVALVSPLAKADRLFVLSFHDRSAFFDESNGINHYLGVYHSAETAGVTSLFWGKYAKHLPVGYKPGEEPSRPPDWRPGEFTQDQIDAATHVLVSWPDRLDGPLARAGALRFREEVEPTLKPMACRGDYCLYAVPPSFWRLGAREEW